jgi:hypothetical protein
LVERKEEGRGVPSWSVSTETRSPVRRFQMNTSPCEVGAAR